MRFNLLGPFEILTDDGLSRLLSTPKVCQVLALLLVRPGEVVSVNTLTRELWGNEPPRSALTTLQTYIYHARRMFEREGLTSADRTLLHTRAPGYRINADPEEVDANVFERLVREGATLLDQGRPEPAATLLRQAVDLWRGPVLATVTAGRVLAEHITHLEELKIRAIEMRVEAAQQLGRHREMIPELRSLVTTYPLNEWLHAQLITSLGRSGRPAEALHAYRDLRRTLNEELGLDPGPELRRIEHELLNPRSESEPPPGPLRRVGSGYPTAR